MLKERSSFDKNFPTLGSKKRSTSNSSKDKETVWKQPVIDSVTPKTTITVTPPNTTTSIPIATIHKQNTTSITASDNITTQAKSIVMNQSPPITKPILHSNVTINTNSVSSNLNEEDSSNSLHQKGKQNLFIPPKLTNTNTKPPQPKIDTVPAPKKGINILKNQDLLICLQ